MLFVTLDAETSGLPFHPQADLRTQPRIIEFAAVLTDGVDILDRLEFICNPGIVIEEVITKITGLKNEDLKDKPPFEHFIPQLRSFFRRARGRIAHNLHFDRSMLEYDCRRLGLTLHDISYFDCDIDQDGTEHEYSLTAIELCTVEQTVQKYGKRMKLEDLWKLHFGDITQEHRGMSDTIMLHQIAQAEGVYAALNNGERKE